MKRARTIAVASTLIALAAVAVGYGTGSAGQPAPTAAPTGSDRAALMAAHQGGTLKLLAKAAGGHDRPAGQLHAPVLAALPGDLRRAARLQEGGRQRGVRGRARTSRPSLPDADERRQDVGVQAPQGDQVLERQDGDAGTTWSRRSSASSRSAARPPARSTPASSARRRASTTPATCTLKGGVIANDEAGTVTINLAAPDPEFKYKLAVPHACILPADTPAEGRRHEAAPRHRRRTVHVVQPEQAARDEAQPVLQAVVDRPRSPTATRTRSS